jgi:uncharacterized protein (DUF2141 family)
MASISVSGTGSAGPTRGWARSLLAALALIALPGAASPGSVELSVAGLRSAKGLIQVCLTADPKHFPDCKGDPAARHLTAPAAKATGLRFDDLPAGSYAISLFHDENGNGKVDTRLGIPTEGVGFSNNPRLWFGPPSFAAARFTVTDQPVAETVKMKYFL